MFRHPWGTSEDDLTRHFFGLMKYLPVDVLLVPFLNLIRSLYPDRKISTQTIKSADILLWPEYLIPQKWRDQFNRPDVTAEKRRSKYYIVPDVVISFDDYVFVVEAEKSHSVEAEQMFQQYMMGRHLFPTTGGHKNLFNLLLNTDQMPPFFCGVTANDVRTGISILPSDSIPQYIVKRAQMLGEAYDIGEISYSYLWISWHHVGRLAEEVLDMQRGIGNEISKLNAGFLSGFKEMMDKEGFYPVRAFRADDRNETYVDDCSCIPVLKRSLDCDLIGYEASIQPSFIPVFNAMGCTANWLAQQTIEPSATAILTKEESHG